MLVVDEDSRKLIDTVVREDDILEEKVMSMLDAMSRRWSSPLTV